MVYVTVADFDPPSALTELREWQKHHGDALDQLPDDAVRIDVGRAANGGDFARVMVDDQFASQFDS
jgi:hypothetical protein